MIRRIELRDAGVAVVDHHMAAVVALMGLVLAEAVAHMVAKLHIVAVLFAVNFLTIVFFLKVFEI